MITKHFITEDELLKFGGSANLADKSRALLNSQKAGWNFLRENYYSLSGIEIKNFEFNEFSINVQFNPGRITSTSAKVDDTSIRERKCFLCLKNLPAEQKGFSEGKYLILCNPYPIFPEHFTISLISHKSQEILKNFPSMLDLTKKLSPHYSLLYNGPRCGASAPDHMHFQAGSKFYMPVEKEYDNLKKIGRIIETNDISIMAVAGNYLRNFISIDSKSKAKIIKIFSIIYKIMEEEMNTAEEPMMNILATYSKDKWRLVIFPRSKHRPSVYFKKRNNLLISPGCVDMCGLLIVPRKEDFVRITSEDIMDIFSEVTLPDKNINNIINKLENVL